MYIVGTTEKLLSSMVTSLHKFFILFVRIAAKELFEDCFEAYEVHEREVKRLELAQNSQKHVLIVEYSSVS